MRKVLFLAAVLMAAAAFCCTAIRAFTTNLTDDEAYTYINYVRAYQPLNLSWLIHLYSTCKANNHWLNTFLIWCTSQVLGPYSEAAIRLPNVVLFAGYLAAVLAALNSDINEFVMIGNLTLLPQCHEVFPMMEQLYNVRFHIPKYSEFCTAIGAALDYLYKK